MMTNRCVSSTFVEQGGVQIHHYRRIEDVSRLGLFIKIRVNFGLPR